MADEDMADETDTGTEPRETPPTEVVVRPLPDRPEVWRARALALRAALPQLARHPAVVGATAAAATVAVRVALDVAHRALTGSDGGAPRTLDVTGTLRHEVTVERHVHLVQHIVHHHVVHHVPAGTLWRPELPPRG